MSRGFEKLEELKQMMKRRAIVFDIGYSKVKTEEFDIPSLVGNARTIRYSTGLSGDEKLNNLTVDLNGKKYFVGDLARRQSEQVFFSLDEDRFKSIETEVLLETTLGLLTRNLEVVNVVTGLPLDYLKYQGDLKAKLEVNPHIVVINDEEHRIEVDKAVIVPQPMAVYFDALFDEYGKIAHPEMAKQTIGIVDIGFGTTDIAYVENMEFIDKFSRSKDIAMNSVYKSIADMVLEDFGVDKEPYEIEQEVRTGSMKIKGDVYDVKDIVEEAYRDVANKLVKWIGTIWKERADLDAIYVAGGGGIALSKYVVPALEGILVDDAQKSILRGYGKLARRVFKE